MNAVPEFFKTNIVFDICLAIAVFFFICNFFILRRVNKKSDHFVSGVPFVGPAVFAAGALTTPYKWLALFALLDPHMIFFIKSIPDISRSLKEDRKKKRYILLKLDDIKENEASLIAELRQIRIITAVYTDGFEVKDTEVVKETGPSFCFTDSDKQRALMLLTKEYKIKPEDIIVLDTVNEINIRTERVKLMESLYDKALKGNASKDDIEVLDKYLSVGFKDDFEADENGMFPDTLKRGVLSEDGLYDLLESLKEKD